MKRNVLSVLLIMLIFSGLQAQRRNGLIGHRSESDGSLILSIGPNYCYGDPYSSKGFFGPIANQSVLKNMDISIGFRQSFVDNSRYVLLGQNVTMDLGYKAGLSYDHFTGDDKNYPIRNFSFNSTVFQLAGQGEYSIHIGKRYGRAYPHTIYGFLGVGALYCKADLLKGTDGGHIGYNYRSTDITPVIPYGFGYHYYFYNTYYIGAEVKWEYTFSDYIDGFKPPKNVSKSPDVLQGFFVTFGYKIF